MRIVLGTILLSWTTYCAVRYFIAFRGAFYAPDLSSSSLRHLCPFHVVYDTDAVRTKYAVAMGTVSLSSTLLYASTLLASLFRRRYPSLQPIPLASRILIFLASVFLIGPATVNIILLTSWRNPRSVTDTRTISGRCNWDVDAVWSGTGQSCEGQDGIPFGAWLAASISRFVVSLLVVVRTRY